MNRVGRDTERRNDARRSSMFVEGSEYDMGDSFSLSNHVIRSKNLSNLRSEEGRNLSQKAVNNSEIKTDIKNLKAK